MEGYEDLREMELRLQFGKIDYSQLPLDCPAAAAHRIRRSLSETGTSDPFDLAALLGDPLQGVSVLPRMSFGEYVRSRISSES